MAWSLAYPAAVYTDELPTTDTLELYDSVERRFLIHCRSGRLIAGGIEDFVNQQKVITSTEDEFLLAPGSYAIQFYELIEKKLNAQLLAELGDCDFQYYAKRSERLPWGCLLAPAILLAAILFYAQLWVAALLVFSLGFIFTMLRRRTQAKDYRFQVIAERVDAIVEDFPAFMFVLQAVDDSTEVSGGWYELR